MEFDIIIVGGGPAGLSAAIKLKQLALQENRELSVCVLEKGAEIGSHTLSGAVLDPVSLKELLPESWQQAPLDTAVQSDRFLLLNSKKAFRIPNPPQMHNKGNYIISLGQLCQFLAQQAETLGCEIYPGFPASSVLYNDKGEVIGVSTGALGIDKNGDKTANYQPGMNLYARQTMFAEGCRGQLSEGLMKRFELRKNCNPQTYGIGLKEIWQVKKEVHQPGAVIHTLGWPLDRKTYGGSFIYHLSDQRVAIGFVVGLDYQNPWMSPFQEFQRFKTHPAIRPLLDGGERLSYGARALNEGGWQSIPRLTFPGGLLIGDSAGFLNVPKIKGIHSAMKSGMLAAEACFKKLSTENHLEGELTEFVDGFQKSSIAKELHKVRNIRPGFQKGLFTGLLNAAFETYISRGHSPWTLKNHADYKTLIPADKAPKIEYPKPDNQISFDRLSSVFLSNTFHEENQPCHLKLKNPQMAIDLNYHEFASPETRYCPAGVYEIIKDDSKPRLQINAQNCIHCKTCDIKDPGQNIQWIAPEGGGGPNYLTM